MSRADVEELRRHGFTDRDVTDIVHNVAVFAYINRVAEGLGLERNRSCSRAGKTRVQRILSTRPQSE